MERDEARVRAWRRLLAWIHHRIPERTGAIDFLYVDRIAQATEPHARRMRACERLFRDQPSSLRIDPPEVLRDVDTVAALVATLGEFAPLEPLLDPDVLFEAKVRSALFRVVRGDSWRRGLHLEDIRTDDPLPRWSLRPRRPSAELFALHDRLAEARVATASLRERLVMANLLVSVAPVALELRDRVWIRDAVNEALATPALLPSTDHLCTIIFDEELASRAAPQLHSSKVRGVLQENLGEEALARMLARALGSLSGTRARRLAEALAKGTPNSATARAFASCLARRGPVLAVATRWLRDAPPELAREALVPKLSMKEDVLVWSRAEELLTAPRASTPAREHDGRVVPPILRDVPWRVAIAERPRASTMPRIAVRAEHSSALVEVMERLESRFDPALLHDLDSPHVAELVARRMAGHSSRPMTIPCTDALLWLHRHPEAAVAGLVPAFTKRETSSLPIDLALREVRAGGHDVIATARLHYGEEVAARLDRRLADDPPERFPPNALGDDDRQLLATLAKELPRPALVETGRALPDDAFLALLELLFVLDARFPSACIDQIQRACTKESLLDLAWALACVSERERESHGDFDYRRRDWLLRSFALFTNIDGDVDAARLLTRLSPRMHGSEVVEMLGLQRTEAVVRELVRISMRHPRWLTRRIGWSLSTVSARRGTTMIDSFETFTPTLWSIPDRVIQLDYGPRTITIRVDPPTTTFSPLRHKLSLDPSEPHPPRLVDEQGRSIEHAPPARAPSGSSPGDDPWKVARAFEAFSALVLEVTHIHRLRVEVLLHLATKDHSFRYDELRARYIDHPELSVIVRGLLFVRCSDDPSTAAFRVAEDGTLSNVDDDLVTLDPGARVRMVRPKEMTEEGMKRWQALFFDYAIVPLLPLWDV